jgi:hypothetical protein
MNNGRGISRYLGKCATGIGTVERWKGEAGYRQDKDRFLRVGY